MSSFWSWFIIIITVGNILGAVWLMYSNTQKATPGTTEVTGHKWDGDLEEFNNPLPRWWLGLFYVTVLMSVAYFVLYPGLGNFSGVLGWSQVGQYQAEVEAADARYAEFYARFADMDLMELAANDEAMAAAGNIFGNNCAACHGADGRGAVGFPNLTDDSWQYGGSPENILATLNNGRSGVMPAQAAVLGEDGVDEVVAYVLSISGRDAPADMAAAGAQRFAQTCAVCHGPDAKGNQMIGAPNLTDDVWVFGGSAASIRETLINGRANQMPAQLPLLGEDRTRLMAAYVLKISGSTGD